MRFPGFISGSYQSQSIIADAEQTINWYVENLESPALSPSSSRLALYPTPGFSPLVTCGADISARAMYAGVPNRGIFVVMGGSLYEVDSNFNATLLGTAGQLGQDRNLATISYNGITGGQLFITSNTNGFCLTLSSNTLSQVLTGQAVMGGFLDQYFLALDPLGTVRLSNLNDGTTWQGTVMSFQNSITPDPWISMLVDGNRKVWLTGSQNGQVYYDAGNFPQPLAPISGAVFPSGTVAPFSACVAGTMPTWLMQSKDGVGIAVAAQGYPPSRISNHAFEYAINVLARGVGISDAETLTYQSNGHLFTIMHFPSAGVTWGFDPIANNQWHQRGKWSTVTASYGVWAPRVHCYAFGRHLVGFRDTGVIAEMSDTISTEVDNTVIRRMRRAPALVDEHRRLPVHRLELLLESGLGLGAGVGSNPLVMMRASADGGQTWGQERRASAGMQGHYRQRVFWTRCGAERNRVFEISVSDPIPWRIVDAWLNNMSQVSGRAA